MNKKQGILIGIALVLLFAGIALATPSTSSDVTRTLREAIKKTNGSPFTRSVGCDILN